MEAEHLAEAAVARLEVGTSSGNRDTPDSNIGNGQTVGGGQIMGVASVSKKQSIKEFNDKDHYDEWYFVYDLRLEQSGGAASPWRHRQESAEVQDLRRHWDPLAGSTVPPALLTLGTQNPPDRQAANAHDSTRRPQVPN